LRHGPLDSVLQQPPFGNSFHGVLPLPMEREALQDFPEQGRWTFQTFRNASQGASAMPARKPPEISLSSSGGGQKYPRLLRQVPALLVKRAIFRQTFLSCPRPGFVRAP